MQHQHNSDILSVILSHIIQLLLAVALYISSVVIGKKEVITLFVIFLTLNFGVSVLKRKKLHLTFIEVILQQIFKFIVFIIISLAAVVIEKEIGFKLIGFIAAVGVMMELDDMLTKAQKILNQKVGAYELMKMALGKIIELLKLKKDIDI